MEMQIKSAVATPQTPENLISFRAVYRYGDATITVTAPHYRNRHHGAAFVAIVNVDDLESREVYALSLDGVLSDARRTVERMAM